MNHLDTATKFDYLDYSTKDGSLSCTYGVGGYEFTERFELSGSWDTPLAQEAARLVFLLAGISYYKSHAPQQIDLGETPVRPGETEFLRQYYLGGLGEFAYKNQISLSTLEVLGGTEAGPAPESLEADTERPLIPFGGGIDSVVTVELARKTHKDAKLFVMSPEETTFAPLEDAAKVTGLEVVRAKRFLDPQILKSKENGFLNGHVPVTGILSAVAISAAIMDGRTAVLMSNEASASEGNLEFDGRMVNHQYSKSLEFENLFRTVLANSIGPTPDWFSFLRHRNELWIAERFAEQTQYHHVFRSCNRAFHIDEASRATNWCGECDKCAFIDLILAPFMERSALNEMFGGNEPIENPDMEQVLRSLVSDEPGFNKPFECVGDISECRIAVLETLKRQDRVGNSILARIADELKQPGQVGASRNLPHNISEPYATSYILD